MQTDTRRDRSGGSRVALVIAKLAEQVDASRAALGAAGGAARVRVLDCGGGSGAYAVPLAASGAEVTVVDISADALATLRRRADEAGVSASVRALAGDVEALPTLVGEDRFDAVLAHGILDTGDAVASVEDTFVAMSAVLAPGGLLSVLVANPAAAVLARALAGDPVTALAELRRLDNPPQSGRLDPDAVAGLAERAGLQVVARYGIGAFSDVVPGAAGDSSGGRQAVRELDAAAASRSPFAEMAGRILFLLRRPPG